MNILQFSIIVSLFFSAVQSKNRCPTSYCGKNITSLPIQYPFKLRGQNLHDCNYTDLSCTDENVPVLTLPFSGDFYVRDVYYDYSQIQLYDPENCLPRRLMSLNLTSSLFYSGHETNYTLYGCPSEIIPLTNLTPIGCLSNASFSVVEAHAISSEVMERLYRCREIFRSIVPVYGQFRGNETDLVLRWYEPQCKSCPTAGSTISPDVVLVTYLMVSFAILIMPAIICIGCCVHFVILFKKEPAQT